ncbi:class I SAM-dependent methyltransferase family protein [Candidatus Woesearchaeota archaeon]|nr:class I SAM-dependent methyltransferase family protein [Candidatus Woesearchaeota archaeon]
MIGAKVSLKKAEEVKKFIINKGLLLNDYWMVRLKNGVIFPVKKKFEKTNVEFVSRVFKKIEKRQNWKQILKKKLSKKEFDILKTAHDVVGSIAILEIPDELKKKEKLIAETLLKANKNVKTVLKKAGEHSGTFRTQKMKWLAGEKTKETIHKENNVRLKVNVKEIYFSARLSTERKRIMKQIRRGVKILVMFSGCAPYPCVFSKNTDAYKIVGIEINPKAHRYAEENVRINKLNNVELILGDVKKVVPNLKERFDRICMPLPRGGENFLKEALMVSKKNTVIHFYDFLHKTEFDKAEEKVKKACDKTNIKCKFLDFVKCGQYSPGKYRICLDFRVIAGI